MGEQVSLLVGELVGGEFVCWPSQTAFVGTRIRRNPEESGASTEFLQKIHVKAAENWNF